MLFIFIANTFDVVSFWNKLKNVDVDTKYRVYGWVRQAEQELSFAQSIVVLYHRNDEYFDNTTQRKSISWLVKILIFNWPINES